MFYNPLIEMVCKRLEDFWQLVKPNTAIETVVMVLASSLGLTIGIWLLTMPEWVGDVVALCCFAICVCCVIKLKQLKQKKEMLDRRPKQ